VTAESPAFRQSFPPCVNFPTVEIYLHIAKAALLPVHALIQLIANKKSWINPCLQFHITPNTGIGRWCQLQDTYLKFLSYFLLSSGRQNSSLAALLFPYVYPLDRAVLGYLNSPLCIKYHQRKPLLFFS